MKLTKEQVERIRDTQLAIPIPNSTDLLCEDNLAMRKMLEESLKSLERTYSYGAHYQIRIKSRIGKLKEFLG